MYNIQLYINFVCLKIISHFSFNIACQKLPFYNFYTKSKTFLKGFFTQQKLNHTKKTKVKLTINNQYEYFTLQEKTQTKIKWHVDSVYPIQMPSYKQQHSLSFELYKNDSYLGRARSFVSYGRNKKDCLDIVNDMFSVIGKFLYEAKWIPKMYQQKMISLDQYYKFGNSVDRSNPYTTQGLQRAKKQQEILKRLKSERGQKRKIYEHNQISSQQQQQISCFSCFSKKNKSILDQINAKKLSNYPLIYKQSQLGLKKDKNLIEQSIIKPMYYSKRYYKEKKKLSTS